MVRGERVWCHGRGFAVQANEVHCIFCGVEVTTLDVSEPGVVVWSRIGGDSGNGYEPYHQRCLPREA